MAVRGDAQENGPLCQRSDRLLGQDRVRLSTGNLGLVVGMDSVRLTTCWHRKDDTVTRRLMFEGLVAIGFMNSISE